MQSVALACPKCKAGLSYKGTSDKSDFVVFECKSGQCPVKAVVLVAEQISEIMKPLLRV